MSWRSSKARRGALSQLAQADDEITIENRPCRALLVIEIAMTDAGLSEPHAQCDQIRSREKSTVHITFGGSIPALGREGAARSFVRIADEGVRHSPRSDPAADRAILPRRCQAQPRAGRHRVSVLAIVKHILNRHQGRMHIESTPGHKAARLPCFCRRRFRPNFAGIGRCHQTVILLSQPVDRSSLSGGWLAIVREPGVANE
jgi:hypothetical protein